MSELASVRIRTYAKLNLFLRVQGARPDGYHEIESILHGIGLGDDIELTVMDEPGFELELETDGLDPSHFPPARDNLIAKAAEQMVVRGKGDSGIAVKLLKRVPPGAGLGGGSANAAGMLVALNELWKMDLRERAILEAASMVGSDVSYCITGGTALATSRGEVLTRLVAPARMWFVLGLSDEPLSTRDVYDAWDRTKKPTSPAASASMTMALAAGDVVEIAGLLHNELEAPALELRPDLAGKKQSLIEAGALGAGMSGSGPTMFALARDESHALGIAEASSAAFDRVLVVRSQPRCIERLD